MILKENQMMESSIKTGRLGSASERWFCYFNPAVTSSEKCVNSSQYTFWVAAQVLRSYPLCQSYPDSIQARLPPEHLPIESNEAWDVLMVSLFQFGQIMTHFMCQLQYSSSQHTASFSQLIWTFWEQFSM